MSGPFGSFPWHEHHVDELRTCIDGGMSAGQAAVHFSAKFLVSVSRNSMIGKALRLNLRWHGAHDGPRRTRAQRASRIARPRVKRLTNHGNRFDMVEIDAPQALPRAIPPAANSQPCDLMGLTSRTCRWPLWDSDEPRLYCGAPEADLANGHAYCKFHTAASIGRRYTPAERRAYHAQREAAE